ncbi:MAG: PEP-CTERM sorting domain-containing protein [Gammaproteobacteria bacterium]|nr:PEP-CTERM sorting domain-containing protein [Gammaproteobacteria bacterium]
MSIAKKITFMSAALLFSLSATTAQADVITGGVTGGSALAAGGTFVELGVPLGNPFGAANSVGDNTFQSPNFYVFNESQNAITTGSLSYDYGVGESTAGGHVGGTIVGGTIVASHYVFFDPGPFQSIQAFVQFDAVILGVITATGTLAASDYLANTGVNYLNPGLRGLEGSDKIISVTGDTVSVNWGAASPGDYIRVLTAFSPGGAAVPEPSAFLLLVLGFMGLALVKKNQHASSIPNQV